MTTMTSRKPPRCRTLVRLPDGITLRCGDRATEQCCACERVYCPACYGRGEAGLCGDCQDGGMSAVELGWEVVQ